MRRITDEDVQELRGKGIRVESDGKRYHPRREPEPQQEKPAPVEPFREDVIRYLMAISASNEANVNGLVQLSTAIVSVIQEMKKPVPKKSWNCTVGRDRSGNISTVNINEA